MVIFFYFLVLKLMIASVLKYDTMLGCLSSIIVYSSCDFGKKILIKDNYCESHVNLFPFHCHEIVHGINVLPTV